MKNYLIFPALFCYCISEVLTSKSYIIWIVLLLVILIRVSFLRNKEFLVVMILVGGLFFVRANTTQTAEIYSGESELVFFPDHFRVNGDLVSGDTIKDDQKVKFTYRLTNKKEKAFFSSLSDPIKVRSSIDKVDKIPTTRNQGEFDYNNFLSHRNIYYSMKLSKIDKIEKYVPKTLFERINVLRIHIIKKLDELPKWLKIHSQSLLLGCDDGSEKEFFNSLSILGIIHLFSLSGLHVLIFVTFFRKLLSTLKITKETTDFILLIFLPFYGILAGSKIGIWRAIILSLLAIVISKSRLNFSRLDIFSLTMIVCLFIQPKSILDMGGQLSFLLSFSLLFLYEGSSSIVSTTKLNLVSLPLICNYTYQISWLVLLANLVFVPFFTYIILPTTLLVSVLPNLRIWNFVNDFFEIVYSFLENISQNQSFIIITGKFSLLIVFIMIVLSLFNLTENKLKNKYLISYIAVFSMAIIFNKFPPFGQVSIIDVGQGDSILVTTPIVRKTFLIDTGGKLSFPQKDWQIRISKNQVETSTIPYLKSQGISKIDRVFLSHKDVDHVGNLPTLLKKFPVSEVSFGTGMQDNKSIRDIISNYPNIKFSSLKQGDTFEANGISWNVLWPKIRSVGENGDSLTLLAKVNQKNWLFTGDLDIAGEEKILNDYKVKIDYLKAGHHGSKTSTGDKFLNEVKPNLALISAGVNNRYGHPSKETIKRLDKYGVTHMNTADYGMITWYYYPFVQKDKIKTFLKGEVIENIRIKE